LGAAHSNFPPRGTFAGTGRFVAGPRNWRGVRLRGQPLIEKPPKLPSGLTRNAPFKNGGPQSKGRDLFSSSAPNWVEPIFPDEDSPKNGPAGIAGPKLLRRYCQEKESAPGLVEANPCENECHRLARWICRPTNRESEKEFMQTDIFFRKESYFPGSNVS